MTSYGFISCESKARGILVASVVMTALAGMPSSVYAVDDAVALKKQLEEQRAMICLDNLSRKALESFTKLAK